MSTIQGTYKNGHVELDRPADWPEGCWVTVAPAVSPSRTTVWDEVNAIRAQLAASGRAFSDSAELLREDRER